MNESKQAMLVESKLSQLPSDSEGTLAFRQQRRKEVAAEIVAALRVSAPPSVTLEAGEASLPTYGNLPWDQLGRDVTEATTGTRSDFPFDEKLYPGHQMPGINFNSLARIIDKYRALSLPQPGAPPSVALDAGREAIAKLVWQRFAPTHHIGWTDETHRAEYLLCADAILALKPK